MRAVNRHFRLPFAVCRTRSRPVDTLSRLGVRRVVVSIAFPLALPLCSTDSAVDCSALFASFIANMGSSDFSGSFITGYDSSPSRCGPLLAVVDPEISRFPGKECARMLGSLTTRSRSSTCDSAPSRVAFRRRDSVDASELIRTFRGSMAGLRVPLPTLHPCPREHRCTAWGRYGSLLLYRRRLSLRIPCRFLRRTTTARLTPCSRVGLWVRSCPRR